MQNLDANKPCAMHVNKHVFVFIFVEDMNRDIYLDTIDTKA